MSIRIEIREPSDTITVRVKDGKPLSKYTEAELEGGLTEEQKASLLYSDDAEAVFALFPGLTDAEKYHINEFVNECGWNGIDEVYIPAIGLPGAKGLATAELVGDATRDNRGFLFSGAGAARLKLSTSQLNGGNIEGLSYGVITNDFTKDNSTIRHLLVNTAGGGNKIADGDVLDTFFVDSGNAITDVVHSTGERIGLYGKVVNGKLQSYLNGSHQSTSTENATIVDPLKNFSAGAEVELRGGEYVISNGIVGNLGIAVLGNSAFDPAVFDPAAKKLLAALSIAQETPENLYPKTTQDQRDYTVAQEVERVYAHEPTGRTAIQRTGDDAWAEQNIFGVNLLNSGRLVTLKDFWNLNDFNAFGNKKRLTGSTGNYYEETDGSWRAADGTLLSTQTRAFAFPDLYAICHWKNYGWYIDARPDAALFTGIDNALAEILAGYDNWVMANYKQLNSIKVINQNTYIQPFAQVNVTPTWHSSVLAAGGSFSGYSAQYGGNIDDKTIAKKYFIVRKHY